MPRYSFSHAVAEDANVRFRPSMEDAHVFIPGFGGGTFSFFGIFDGHGGSLAATTCARRFPEILSAELQREDNGEKAEESPAERAFIGACRAMDEELRVEPMQYVGTTAVMGIAGVDDSGVPTLVVANVGDSRAVLCRAGGRALRVTRDHKPSDPEEADRVKASGGFIGRQNRVNGVLTLTRALGDHAMKNVVISRPHVMQVSLERGDSFLIAACDGLWDVLSDQQAVDLIAEMHKAGKPLQEMADFLVFKSIELGTTDNVTVMVIDLTSS
jgi:protein phosphatase PTC1